MQNLVALKLAVLIEDHIHAGTSILLVARLLPADDDGLPFPT